MVLGPAGQHLIDRLSVKQLAKAAGLGDIQVALR